MAMFAGQRWPNPPKQKQKHYFTHPATSWFWPQCLKRVNFQSFPLGHVCRQVISDSETCGEKRHAFDRGDQLTWTIHTSCQPVLVMWSSQHHPFKPFTGHMQWLLIQCYRFHVSIFSWSFVCRYIYLQTGNVGLLILTNSCVRDATQRFGSHALTSLTPKVCSQTNWKRRIYWTKKN